MLEGRSDLAALPRLADRLDGCVGMLNWRIEGTSDAQGRLALVVAVNGEVSLECQRCLGPFRHSVAQRTLTVLARSEAEADAMDGAIDDEVLVADRPIDPVKLVEDELLLTLPYAPMHAEGSCGSVNA